MRAVLDPELPALAVVLDTDRLSALFGQVLQADYLRYKPGHSVVARVRFDDGRLGWLAGFSPGQWVKAAKLAQRAGQHPELRNVRLRTEERRGGKGGRSRW